jgi:ABC-type sugar transport system ATPase subunit
MLTDGLQVTTRGDTAAETSQAPLLEVRHLDKSFGPVRVLTDVGLTVPAGQVTALAGDNGAGKSVLIKCIAGIHRPDRGEILWDGAPVVVSGPRAASSLGIATVYQDLALCDNLDIVANMFLGREVWRHGVLDEARMELAAQQVLRDLSVTTVQSVRQVVGSLSGGQRQSVAIAKAVLGEARLVIMDEPTAALGVAQTEVVLSLIRRLAERGLAVLMISHNMVDLFRVADRVAVLYLGRMVAVERAADLDRRTVVDLMATGVSDRFTPGPTDASGTLAPAALGRTRGS